MKLDLTKHHFRCTSQHYGNEYCNCLDIQKIEDVAKMPFTFLAEMLANLHVGVPVLDRANGISTYKCKECKVESPCTTLKTVEKFTKKESDEETKVK